ncbi:MAG: TetR/AcrR family transcriptional regulator [Spirochaetae bacterium HGW-Spirochaetae-1]|jgi:TetR/AcrR family transcriptional repressor of nem operon|nr:MAG: TetR/AcrR family transcriptional regulator [Spirochaetae bacterium HGW-Spirochaetae-1]
MTEKTKGEMTREHILGTAVSLINTRGFGNTGISHIIEATGVKKGNLYFHFHSKEELGLAIIDEASRQYNDYLKGKVKGDTCVDKLYSLVDAVFRYHRSRGFTGGCIFGNTALEMADTNEEFSRRISRIFREWVSMITSLIEGAVKAGELDSSIVPPALAKHVVALLEGGIMLSRVSKDERDMRQCISSLKELIESKRNA